jgi:hypothetical protein
MGRRRWIVVVLAAATVGVTLARVDARQKPRPQTAPETFSSPVQAKTGAGVTSAVLDIQIDRYTPEADRKAMSDALTQGGYPGFMTALKIAPVVGTVSIGDQKFNLRWAREQSAAKGRTISLVTDAPIYFVGGGRVDAKPREGFQIAVVQLTVDEYGNGTGSMAAAARVKPDGKGGVILEDYAEEPIALKSVYRKVK